MTADPPESLQQTRALYYIVAATVITFKLGHLKIFSFNEPKSCCDQPKITHPRLKSQVAQVEDDSVVATIYL